MPSSLLGPVVLDTCVLFPPLVRDVLLSLADGGLFDPCWSPQILDELVRNLEKLRPPPNVRHLVARMSQAFPEACLDGYQHLVPTLTCDPKDRHVLALAIHAEAEVLVTRNLADFPADSLAGTGVRVLDPDPFALELLGDHPDEVVRALAVQVARRDPAGGLPGLLAELRAVRRMPGFAAACQYLALRGWD